MTNYLSKSDFKVAKECATKLYYKKQGYPNTKEANKYLQLLAEGGYIVGKMAQLLYPEGIEIKSEKGPKEAIKETEELLKQENITLFEPEININNKLIRIDILEKRGNVFNLIEVKAKSFDGKLKNQQFWNRRSDEIKTDWKPYLEDVAFQVMALKEKFPKAQINGFLMMPDKSKATNIDGLAKWFHISESERSNKLRDYQVDFVGDLDELHKEEFLALVNVSTEVDYLMIDVQESSNLFIESLKDELIKIEVPISKSCKGCEYNVNEVEGRNGYKECWKQLADVNPHIFDLYYAGTLGKGQLVDNLIHEKKVSLYDIQEEDLTGIKGNRQKVQIEYTKKNEEWFHPDFENILKSLEFPLHFIDFETYQSAIPYHKGMRPYERVAFQWSCHTLERPDSEPIHKEFLNIEDLFPNFQFAESLMEAIGYKGTILIWSSYENAILKDIYNQANNCKLALNYNNPELIKWLKNTAKLEKDDDMRMVDLNKLCLQYYFHPEMKGKTSIKYVLPAIWNNNPYLHKIGWLRKYYKEEDGEVINPYKALEQIEIAGSSEEVREGTGAMKAYEDMVYGVNANNPEIKTQWASLLKEYCKLDTIAMTVIWKYWFDSLSEKNLI
ncbi:MAG: DUF2779 domain-containing protein [Candidatus Caenarcaniphilales bacterium]|nr:DUF2779 domain-containing protein [Candidatus Caenarcaniphilales bacterium]